MTDKEAFDRQQKAQSEAARAAYEASKQRHKLDPGPGKAAAAAPAPMAEHTVASGDTLGAIALKYYQSAAREKWMAIYEANKEIIGDNPSLIKPGQVLQIPKLD